MTRITFLSYHFETFNKFYCLKKDVKNVYSPDYFDIECNVTHIFNSLYVNKMQNGPSLN